ncbi:ran-specific GTPase-activating protein-like [Trichogramma pretiosum]|uniref:ran-specific GTPase-activating protein-like n=1 Tax=Trichogramma pretiosum TaxID=7493 RepID=UPI0006C95788|nr:ran-specific GTPase-activating protein-like [Trichogramma pretiosum]
MPEIEEKDQTNENENGSGDESTDHIESPPQSPTPIEPIIPLQEVSNNEEEEEELIKLRAKLYRYDTFDNPAEWKERGTGEVKMLQHKTKNTVRIVMRRDKTLKLCANHFVWPWMELNPNCGSDRAWVWSALADFADDTPKPQLLAIRFATTENAKLWKEMFETAKKIVETKCQAYVGRSHEDGEVENATNKSFGDTTSDSLHEDIEKLKVSEEETAAK